MFQGSPFTAHCVLFSSTSLVMCHVFVISGSKHEKHMFPSDSWMRFPIYYISQYLQKSWVVKQPKGLVKSDSWHPDVMLVTHTHTHWGKLGPFRSLRCFPDQKLNNRRYKGWKIWKWTAGTFERWRSLKEYNYYICRYLWCRLVLLLFNVVDISCSQNWSMKEWQEGRKQCIYCTFDSSTTHALYCIDVHSKATPPQMPPSKGLGFLTHSLSFQYVSERITNIHHSCLAPRRESHLGPKALNLQPHWLHSTSVSCPFCCQEADIAKEDWFQNDTQIKTPILRAKSPWTCLDSGLLIFLFSCHFLMQLWYLEIILLIGMAYLLLTLVVVDPPVRGVCQ